MQESISEERIRRKESGVNKSTRSSNDLKVVRVPSSTIHQLRSVFAVYVLAQADYLIFAHQTG